MLGELAEMAMAAARAFTGSAIASAKAEEAVLADEAFVPEVGRARACGAKAAAESFQKAARAVRLTLMLEMNLAEIVRDIRAGRVTYLGGLAVRKESGLDAGARADDGDRDRRSRDARTERLVDVEAAGHPAPRAVPRHGGAPLRRDRRRGRLDRVAPDPSRAGGRRLPHASRAKSASSRAAARLMSGQVMAKTSVP